MKDETENQLLDHYKIVDPKLGDKYSPNLFKWLRGGWLKDDRRLCRVFVDVDGLLWIGYEDDGFYRACILMAVLCNGTKEKLRLYSSLVPFVKVTDFWSRYVRDGRCAIDQDHTRQFIDDKRWLVTGDHRECQWCCNFSQYLHKWQEVIDREEWINNEKQLKSSGQLEMQSNE